MMRQGGNNQIRRFFEKLEIENSPIQALYCTKGANHYRERLRERVDKIMSGEIKSERRVSSGSPDKKTLKSDDDTVSKINSSPTTDIKSDVFKILFGEGAMGMTLTKDSKERASVSKLVPAGPAQANGVKIGDYIIGVAGKSVNNYEEIMHMIPCMSRPLEIQFSRITKLNNKVLESKKSFLSSSVSEKGSRKLNIEPLTINRSQSMKDDMNRYSPLSHDSNGSNGKFNLRSKSTSDEDKLEYDELEEAITKLTKSVKTLKSSTGEGKGRKFFSRTASNMSIDVNTGNDNIYYILVSK